MYPGERNAPVTGRSYNRKLVRYPIEKMPVPNHSPSSEPPLFTGALRRITKKPLLGPVTGALSKLLKLEHLDQFYIQTRESAPGSEFVGEVLNRLRISVDISQEDLARIPKKGPVVAVANHPFGMAEAIAATWLLAQNRADFRVLANDMLGALPEVRPYLIMVDPFGGEAARRSNRRGLREALEWLQNGGMLLIFPAGEVSHLHFRHPGIHDPDWHRTAAALIKHTGAAALPFYFEGANSALFQLAGDRASEATHGTAAPRVAQQAGPSAADARGSLGGGI